MSVTPRMHHVVYAVAPERLDAATAFFSELGFTFATFELGELGVQVTLDWAGGVELISPLDTGAGRNSAVAEFLAPRGDGVHSVAVRVADIATAEEVAARYGALTRFRQHRMGNGFELDESEMTVAGLPITLLETDLP
jgi:catechol 2,3-dioxygenase-like lactoylglutathione lyase family enzyme